MSSSKRMNLTAGLASVAVAGVLVVAKLWALAATGSLAVGASLADSGLDLMVSLGALAAIAYAARPPDEDHAYGHTSAEDLAALGQSVFVVVAGVALSYAALARLFGGEPVVLASEREGIAVMVLSIVLTLALVVFQRRVAARTGNKVVAADSLHYLGDLGPNVGAIVALVAAREFGLGYIDGIVALAAAAFMVVGGLRIGKGAFDALMDRQAPTDLIKGVMAVVRADPHVRGFHDLKTRMAGSRVFVTLHIELDGEQTLHQAHDIGAALRRRIIAAYPQADVMIHKDVWHPDGPR